MPRPEMARDVARRRGWASRARAVAAVWVASLLLVAPAPVRAAQHTPERACSDDPTTERAVELGNFADPFVFCDGGRLYAVASNWHDLQTPARDVLVPVARFEPGAGWRLRQENGRQLDAMLHPPPWSWSHPPGTEYRDLWAPEIKGIGGRYVLYFSARHASAVTPAGRHRPCIGAAVSDKPDGGFVPKDTALLCTEFAEGVIDPSPVEAGGKLYLAFKVDGNCCGLRAGLYVTRLTPDGLAVVGAPQALGVVNDRLWEGPLVEAPTLVKHGPAHVLFYSGEVFSQTAYSVGYALCPSLPGPCRKPEPPRGGGAGSRDGRILRARDQLEGPGHQSVFQANGRDYIAFAALVPGTPHDDRAERYLRVAPLNWKGDEPAEVRP